MLGQDGRMQKEILAVLHNIRSNHNTGSVFRTAECAGVSKIYLAGYTPAPLDRFGRPNDALIKTALGAEHMTPWERAEDTLALIANLKKEGVMVVAVEQDVRAIPYTTHTPAQKTAYIFGPEVEGLPLEILDVVDLIVEIPMHGKKESLNVSVAAGVILFYARNAENQKT